ncbi:MAG: excinuclease ABC subunit UvrC [Bacilli bacterium]|nr:excinuclease ABC subunit UvrC [Bacilli bacterium]MDD3895469.1 excinuclease ABC subunit UvrC [Bacilli bacterium]MDD4407442.1 excinuclease ABC subunit UvrC [Bacilli bacterium]
MFSEELKLVPNKPGSYQMYNENNIIIYIGKAKNLKKRLSSYFRMQNTGKTAKMVSEIAYFKYIVTETELESFLLELNLIKEYNPKYNILLKDDKSYPYIELIKKPYPKLRVVRYLKVKKYQDRLLFGPYVNAYAARRMVNLINRLYPLKKCQGLPKDVCLYYHINECLGYCNYDINKAKIKQMEDEIISFLKGNDAIIKNKLIEKLNYYSKEMNYELALELKNELNYIKIILEKQKVELYNKENLDVINYYYYKEFLGIEILFIRGGKLIGSFNDVFYIQNNYLEEIESYIALFYNKKEIPKLILVPQELNINLLEEVLKTNITVPLKGNKRKILNMAYENAKINVINNYQKNENLLYRSKGANQELSDLLGINIIRIDAFDNSNLFGSFAVSGMVVFNDGTAVRKEYRKYKVTVNKNDDYNTMKEIIYRRYKRALIEKSLLPDLILVDGGVNQIRAAKEVIDELNLNIKICGLVKNKDHKTKELIDGDNLEAYKIDKTSNLFHYLTRIQDEVHRYTINYHKQLRSKGSISSILDNIPGIGPKRKMKLIKNFGSIQKIKEANKNELKKYLPDKTISILKDYLNKNNI